jgi:hypothetical protein
MRVQYLGVLSTFMLLIHSKYWRIQAEFLVFTAGNDSHCQAVRTPHGSTLLLIMSNGKKDASLCIERMFESGSPQNENEVKSRHRVTFYGEPAEGWGEA